MTTGTTADWRDLAGDDPSGFELHAALLKAGMTIHQLHQRVVDGDLPPSAWLTRGERINIMMSMTAVDAFALTPDERAAIARDQVTPEVLEAFAEWTDRMSRGAFRPHSQVKDLSSEPEAPINAKLLERLGQQDELLRQATD